MATRVLTKEHTLINFGPEDASSRHGCSCKVRHNVAVYPVRHNNSECCEQKKNAPPRNRSQDYDHKLKKLNSDIKNENLQKISTFSTMWHVTCEPKYFCLIFLRVKVIKWCSCISVHTLLKLTNHIQTQVKVKSAHTCRLLSYIWLTPNQFLMFS